jgi:hypothetical protein
MSFRNARIYRKRHSTERAGAFRALRYPVWPHPENRKPAECVNEHNGDVTPIDAKHMTTWRLWPGRSKGETCHRTRCTLLLPQCQGFQGAR